MESEVAVVIPYYNCERFFIKRTIESILDQTYRNFKLYIVNDGSHEEKKQMIMNLVKELDDERIILLHKENSGTGDTRKYGIEYSQEKYIALCDQDDTWVPTKLEKQKEFLEENNYDFVSCRDVRHYFEGETLVEVKENDYEPIDESADSLDAAKRLLCHIKWQGGLPSTMFFKREIFINSLPYLLLEKDITEDISMLLAISYCDIKFGYSDEKLVFYSLHPDNKSKSINTNETYNLKHIFYYLDLYEKKISPREFVRIKKQTLYNTYLNYSGRLFDAGEIKRAYEAIKYSLRYKVKCKNLRRFFKYKFLLAKLGKK